MFENKGSFSEKTVLGTVELFPIISHSHLTNTEQWQIWEFIFCKLK